MRASSAIVVVAAALFSQVSATIYVTQPISSTTCAASQACTVAWNDDGNAPALATIGACSIDLCTGGVQQQTCLQNISPSTDVSQTAQLQFFPNPSVGESGDMWFIKFTSLAYKDPTNPQFPFTAFSAKLTLTGMTGTFNATIESEIAGASVAAGVATTAAVVTTSAAPAAATGASSMTIAKVTASSTGSGTAKATTSTTAAKASGAFNIVSSILGVSVAAGLAGLAAIGL